MLENVIMIWKTAPVWPTDRAASAAIQRPTSRIYRLFALAQTFSESVLDAVLPVLSPGFQKQVSADGDELTAGFLLVRNCFGIRLETAIQYYSVGWSQDDAAPEVSALHRA